MAIQIGKYKRPGIFVEEFDQSIITSPTTEGVDTMVIGFSKKGPVNNPIRLTNLNDLESIFGPIDRGLERKGSYFHRTISKILESTPVYALNLLATDDTLDQVQYRQLSAASSKLNGDLLYDSYRKLFNTTGFWKRETDEFIDMTRDDSAYNDTVINFTNVSDRPISVFIFKTDLTGFDRTLIEWYGTAEKVPPYLNVNDYASDYMVDVIVVGGDWSNYSVLSVDPRWSRYFDSDGLKKSMVREFANDRNINLLGYYEGLSLIPYFRDGNGRNIFIESVINKDTDKSGLFCAFNIDLVETDYPVGMLDLLGNTLVGTEISSIDFLSYKGTINEIVNYGEVRLDSVGNVSALVGTYSAFRSVVVGDDHGRRATNGEGYVYNVSLASYTSGASGFTFSYTLGTGAYAIIGGVKVDVSGPATFNIATASFPSTNTTVNYTVAVVLRSTGEIRAILGTTPGVNPSVNASDIVLTYFTVDLNSNGTFSNLVRNHVSVDGTAYVEFVHNTDYTCTVDGDNLVVEFLNTDDSADTSNYLQYRKIKYFNHLVNLLSSPNKDRMTMIVDASTFEKLSLENVTVSSIITSDLENKAFTLTFDDLSLYPHLANGLLVMYTLDNEFILGKNTIVTKDTVWTSTEGVAAKYSDFYLNFLNGTINNGDYFYTNYVDREAGDEFNVDFLTYDQQPYIVLTTTSGSAAAGAWPSITTAGDKMLLPNSLLNNTVLTIADGLNEANSIQVNGATAGIGDGTDGVYAFRLEETVVDESLLNITSIYDQDLKHYLSMFIDITESLNVTLVNSSGTALALTNAELALNKYSMDVYSNKVNYKQTVEVVYPAGYVSSNNKILVDAERYSVIKVGDFLEAYVDNSLLQPGETPKKLTRILGKKAYAADTSLVEISCDARINVVNLGTTTSPDYQTTRYTQVKDYFNSYKAITLGGFKIRQASIPDGTEERQNEILNLVAKGTPIFNALVNKEAIDFRYLIDSFGLGLTERSKQQLVDICGDRLDCLGFINMPSMKQFKNSTNPSFTNESGVLDTGYIAKGANPESNPNFYYSFGDGRGSTTVGYFCPYLQINDNDRILEVPPAMFVATTYLRKHNSNITSIVPWTIAAGVTNGKVTGFDNVEMDFSYVDIENLNQAQMNPIVFKRNRGFVIETENTAQTLYKSALSYIHVREVLIELERELSRMLLDFQWKFNTPETRAEIKLRADVICETYVSRNGLYNYFNKCDDENNPPEVIDNQIGVLDTYVEPIKGMGIIVNNITILRTGAIQSGGFIIP
jgi:hypothetical protein